MLGQELRAIREKRGLSLAEIAAASGISREALGAVERGDRYPTLRTLEALCECLNLHILIGPSETIIEER